MNPEKVKNVIKSVAGEDVRKSNLIVFGLSEETNEDLTNAVFDVFEAVSAKPKVIECSKMGRKKQEHHRPIKVKNQISLNI